MLERDLALVELTGAALLWTNHHRRRHRHASGAGRERGLPVTADHLDQPPVVNEIDIGDYRTFCKGRPALRGEGRPARR